MTINDGLRKIVVLESKISRVEGEKGILEYRGFNIKDLVKHSNFEEVAFLLLYDRLPNGKELKEFNEDLIKRRDVPREIISFLKSIPRNTKPAVVLRNVISYFCILDEKVDQINEKENLEKAKDLIAKIPTITAFWYRIRKNKSLIFPDKKLSHAANFLKMLHGKTPSKEEEEIFDKVLILHAENGLAASTFAARIAASTLVDVYTAVEVAAGTLAGILHGRASQKTMEMLKELIGKKDIEKWVENKLKRKEKIIGFGHRVYKKGDPRTPYLRNFAKELKSRYFPLTEELVRIMEEKKNLYPNVDFYPALIYSSLEIPEDFYLNIFIMARTAGWLAHIIEQYKENVLIRPLHRYIGEKNREYKKIH